MHPMVPEALMCTAVFSCIGTIFVFLSCTQWYCVLFPVLSIELFLVPALFTWVSMVMRT